MKIYLPFLYLGVANIYQENLEVFLALAEELQLKGLTGGAERRDDDASVGKSLRTCIYGVGASDVEGARP